MKKKNKLPAEKLRKPLGVLVKFKSMEDLLLNYPYWFDHHGNLWVSTMGNSHGSAKHLAPAYFSWLGKLKRFERETYVDSVFIEKEYADIFEPNMALRHIASGKFDKDDCVRIAKEGVIFP